MEVVVNNAERSGFSAINQRKRPIRKTAGLKDPIFYYFLSLSGSFINRVRCRKIYTQSFREMIEKQERNIGGSFESISESNYISTVNDMSSSEEVTRNQQTQVTKLLYWFPVSLHFVNVLTSQEVTSSVISRPLKLNHRFHLLICHNVC